MTRYLLAVNFEGGVVETPGQNGFSASANSAGVW